MSPEGRRRWTLIVVREGQVKSRTLPLSLARVIVLGGVALTGGIGSVIGAVAAGIILFFLNPILTAMGVDPNRAQIIRGLLIVLVMMLAGLLEWRRLRKS